MINISLWPKSSILGNVFHMCPMMFAKYGLPDNIDATPARDNVKV